ncbi:MAG TPA: VOC family protein [Opitutales bacterium]|jgi:uncharacterized glyoxalase superfamily protein PhnB|nr:VOC family protein [Opitutales bacterium]
MKFTGLTPMLWVKDIAQAVQFYREVLGFECVKQVEGWACMKRDKVEIMFSLPNAHEPHDPLQFTGSFYFRVDEVDALWNQLKDQATVVYPIEDFPYGMREFAIRDNTGYILQFGREIGNR